MDFEGLEADFAQIQWPLPHHIPAINDDLIADLAQIQWPVPHHIPAINEEYEAERLYPLEGRFMNLPVLHIQDLDLLVRALNLPPPVQGLFVSNFSLSIYFLASYQCLFTN